MIQAINSQFQATVTGLNASLPQHAALLLALLQLTSCNMPQRLLDLCGALSWADLLGQTNEASPML